MFYGKIRLFTAFLVVSLATSVAAQQSPAPDFVPDYVFEGSDVSAFRNVGAAAWSAASGAVTADAASGGGLLMLPLAYQNAAFFSRFRCTNACDAGIVFRIEETADGFRGVMVAIEGETITPYRVAFNADGRLISKESARSGGDGGAGAASPPASDVIARARDSLSAPVTIQPGAWNSVTVILHDNAVYNHLNGVWHAVPHGTAQEAGPAPEPMFGGAVVPTRTSPFAHGPIALYVGSGRVEFDDVAAKNLLRLEVEPEIASDRFRVQRVNDFYYAWGADVADVNGDGIPDLISGPFYYLGPDFKTRVEYYPPRTYNPGSEYVSDMLTFANDWTGNGWVDVVRQERRGFVMHVNPEGEDRYWDRIDVLPDVCSEIVVRGDVLGDGRPELVYIGNDGRVALGRPDLGDPNGPWWVHKISEPIFEGCNSHGIGFGDVTGNGRMDVVSARGWWEQPETGADRDTWIYHDHWFGRITRPPVHPGGAEIVVYDFNGNGLSDVVTSHSAHGWGLSWYEQQRDEQGNISFQEHHIMRDYSTRNAGEVTFSQLHSGVTLADIDGDGIMDFVTGKRHWSHLDGYGDPDPHGEAVVYWYRTVRDPNAPGGVRFEPELIHNKSGVGSEVKVLDVNGNGMMDVVTSGTRGTFIFWGIPEAERTR